MKNDNLNYRARLFPLTALLMILALLILLAAPPGVSALDLGSFKRKTNRDPFVPPIGLTPSPAKTVITPVKTAVAPVTTKPQPAKLIEVDSGLSMTGVITTVGGYWAILSTPGGKSYLVRRGQKVGDWTVFTISANKTTLRHKNMISRIPLKKQVKP